MSGKHRILIIGYGNPGRLDDGLGPAFAEEVKKLGLPDVDVESDYQLTVEDAHQVSEYGTVIFADASVVGERPFSMAKLRARYSASGFSSHSVQPGAVVGLARRMFGWRGCAYVLGIRGYGFNEFGEGISKQAAKNLRCAVRFTKDMLQKRVLATAGLMDGGQNEKRKTRNSLR